MAIPICKALPEFDFPPGCAAMYPPDFCYPFGYLARPEQVIEAEELEQHEPWLRPFLIRWKDQVIMDQNTPVPVCRLARGHLDISSSTAIRCLEWGDTAQDPAMKAAFRVEDIVTEAGLWSESGAHEKTLEIIRSVPRPYQQTASALVALVRSLKSLARYNEALVELDQLIAADGISEYARELYRIEKAEILLHLDRHHEAEALLDGRSKVFETFWPYYGMRASLALLGGKIELAQACIMKAGRLDPFHAYKLLWNRHLAPLATFIRRELLTEDNKPRLYERDKAVRRICHSIHGALMRKSWREAWTLAESLLPSDVTCLSCAKALALALTGVGNWQKLAAVLPALPGGDLEAFELVILLAHWMLRGENDPTPVLAALDRQSDLRQEVRDEFAALLHWHIEGRKTPLPPEAEVVLVDVALKNWGPGNGRDHWVLFQHPIRGLLRQKFFQDRSLHNPLGWTLRENFEVLEENILSPCEAEAWLERLLEENNAERGFIGYKWTIHWNGWGLLAHIKPGSQSPILAEAVRLAGDDPNFYFHNGPASTSGMNTIDFTGKMLLLLRQCFSGGQCATGPAASFRRHRGLL